MGSAALAACAGRGVRAIGVERFARGHSLGASNGKSRIIRQAYFEHPAYVPLLVRAYERWRALEARCDERLLQLCGMLMVGKPGSDVIDGALRAAREHGLTVVALDARDIRARYPDVRVFNDETGIFEPLAGFVRPEAAVEALLRCAQSDGASLRFECGMRSWSAEADGVTLELDDGSSVRAARLVLTLGPWFGDVLAEVGVRLTIQRNVQVWFEPKSDAFEVARFPVFLLDREGLPAPIYGFPDAGDGVKAAFHGLGPLTAPDGLDRSIDPARDVAPLAGVLDAWMPGAAGRILDAKACMYALTPDENFVIDLHPEHQNVVVCGGFSGHGFKFASVVGELAADLALGGGTDLAIDFLSLRRFSRGSLPANSRSSEG